MRIDPIDVFTASLAQLEQWRVSRALLVDYGLAEVGAGDAARFQGHGCGEAEGHAVLVLRI